MANWPWKVQKDEGKTNYALTVDGVGIFAVIPSYLIDKSITWTVKHDDTKIGEYDALEPAMSYCEGLAIKLGGKKPSQYDLDVEL